METAGAAPSLPSCPGIAAQGASAHLDGSLLGAGDRAEVGDHGLRGRQVRVPFRAAPLLGRASQDKLYDLYNSIYLKCRTIGLALPPVPVHCNLSWIWLASLDHLPWSSLSTLHSVRGLAMCRKSWEPRGMQFITLHQVAVREAHFLLVLEVGTADGSNHHVAQKRPLSGRDGPRTPAPLRLHGHRFDVHAHGLRRHL